MLTFRYQKQFCFLRNQNLDQYRIEFYNERLEPFIKNAIKNIYSLYSYENFHLDELFRTDGLFPEEYFDQNKKLSADLYQKISICTLRGIDGVYDRI